MSATTIGKLYYQRAYKMMENRVIRSKGFRRKWRLYCVYQGTGHFYKRTGTEKRKFVANIVGERGEWYRLISGKPCTKIGPFKTRDEAATTKQRAPKGQGKSKPTRKYFGVRRGYGDDLYSWAVYDKQTDRTILDGESRHQAGYYADKFERERLAKIREVETDIMALRDELSNEEAHSEDRESWKHELDILLRNHRNLTRGSCGCREPKSHRDCCYCGVGWAGPVICGECAEAGIDHDESAPNRGIIKGTERRTCSFHK